MVDIYFICSIIAGIFGAKSAIEDTARTGGNALEGILIGTVAFGLAMIAWPIMIIFWYGNLFSNNKEPK